MPPKDKPGKREETLVETTKGKPPPRVKVPTIRRIKAILVK
jgi:hypothetical protein